MSGGFFRGTSADQDTRFSNKQAKLMKSQKFAPELEHLVDMTKVTMDVMKPWIAKRVTEFLGFEDEVLINFIYGLLDGKEINGKEVQIQITGFMEKNTGKFMKELWGLLLSAQSNASGVPQQFLDAKEEEIRQKKAESDRITHEIQKKKEIEKEKLKKMDDDVDDLRDVDHSKHSSSKFLTRDPDAQPEEGEKESDVRNGSRGRRISRSPHAAQRSPSSERTGRSRSISRSFSNSTSYSDGRHKSASRSKSPPSREHAISPKRRFLSPRKRSMSPRGKFSQRRARSPVRRRSPLSRHRSSSGSWGRSPSRRRCRSPTPVRRRPSPIRRRRSPSPRRRRSPSLRRRRSPSPFRRRSPPSRRHRSRSPTRRRSPSLVRHESPSPVRRRSPLPMRRRSPLRRRSPALTRRRSRSPPWHRSPSPPPRRSPSPVRRGTPPRRSPKQRRRSPLRSSRQRDRSASLDRSPSPADRSRRSLSRDDDNIGNGVGSKGYLDYNASQRTHGGRSPLREISERGGVGRSGQGHKGPDPIARQPPISLRSPQQDPRDKIASGREVTASLLSEDKSPSRSESSPSTRKSSPSQDRSLSGSPIRIMQDSASPIKQTRNRVTRRGSPESDREEGTHFARGDGVQRTDSLSRRNRHSPKGGNRNVPHKEPNHGGYSPMVGGRQSGEAPRRLDDVEISKKVCDKKSEKASTRIDRPVTPQRLPITMEEVKYPFGRIEGARISPDYASDEPSLKQSKFSTVRRSYKSRASENHEVDEKKHSRSHSVLDSGLNEKTDSERKTMRKVDSSNKSAYLDSDSDKNEKKSEELRKRKLKRSGRREMSTDDDASSDSQLDERKAYKRRRKEEKRLRKEERRKRRHERHRRREERRAAKVKAKPVDTVPPPSDIEKIHKHTDDSDGHGASKRDSHPSDTEEMESEQKKLEIELRKKALESLRAKKAINP